MAILRPVFAGRTAENELIVLYEREEPDLNEKAFTPLGKMRPAVPGEYHLLCPDGRVWALDHNTTKIIKWMDEDLNYERIQIESEPWSGEARGSRLDLMEAQAKEYGFDPS